MLTMTQTELKRKGKNEVKATLSQNRRGYGGRERRGE
jgi:hypothetical protein